MKGKRLIREEERKRIDRKKKGSGITEIKLRIASVSISVSLYTLLR